MKGHSIIEFVLIAIVVVWFIYSRFAGVKGVRNMSAAQFEQCCMEHPDAVIVDVREPGEVKRGRIPRAINVPLSQFKSRMIELPKDKPIYLYCQSGMRSKQAARMLRKNGYKDLTNLQGGMMAWRGKLVNG